MTSNRLFRHLFRALCALVLAACGTVAAQPDTAEVNSLEQELGSGPLAQITIVEHTGPNLPGLLGNPHALGSRGVPIAAVGNVTAGGVGVFAAFSRKSPFGSVGALTCAGLLHNVGFPGAVTSWRTSGLEEAPVTFEGEYLPALDEGPRTVAFSAHPSAQSLKPVSYEKWRLTVSFITTVPALGGPVPLALDFLSRRPFALRRLGVQGGQVFVDLVSLDDDGDRCAVRIVNLDEIDDVVEGSVQVEQTTVSVAGVVYTDAVHGPLSDAFVRKM